MTRGFGRLRREDLLRTACDVIAARGFGHTRTADIAQAAGVSQALLFYHFETKEKLFAQAFSYAAQLDLEALAKIEESGGSPLDRLRALIRLYAPTGKSKSWALWIDARAESMRNPELEETSRGIGLRWRQALRAVIEDGVRSGLFVCDDPEGTTWRIISLLDGLSTQVTVHRRVLSRARMAELVGAATARELGVFPADLL
ncbi:AcrR family transcriptional regulator [Streptosporangium becharense]|uniref:AcrR family transcriptional regulator n=1 Tax=Streptosporangium becharense TaxID=1816182 RepID=A0A7W9IKB4_9ACTN|nr:TetR/AcrR family transcriptional regulator [Streptosporangium becharense]MBB2913332.1 AcrR family transcriptional regulator [Streptosporangium becharense]MBB5822315.1 AcrR family transcriptional regulator [Streptosporangium becharense]